MKLTKKRTLAVFFIIKDLHPFFFELLIDSVKDFNNNLTVKTKNILKLKKSNKIITLFPIYLNLFSAKILNTQKNTKEAAITIKNENFVALVSQQRIFPEVLILKKEANLKHTSFFPYLYLSKDKKSNTSEIIKSAQIIKNLKEI